MLWTDRIDPFVRDLRFAWRGLRRSPVFTLAVVATLGLGIGANTAIFSFVSGVLLRPLPFGNDRELVVLRTALPKFGPEATSVPDYNDWKEQNHSFSAMTATSFAAENITTSGSDPERVRSAKVLADFFSTFGVRAAIGRGFTEEDNRVGSEHVVVLSDALWRRRFAANPAIVGTTVMLSGIPHTVIGVAPPRFAYPVQAELWTPLAFGGARPMPPRRADFLAVVGRLKPGISLEAAQADMSAIGKRLEASYPNSNKGVGIDLRSLRAALVGDVRSVLFMLAVAVGFVLLIACANIANLLMARATARQREMAVRMALGAGRARLAAQVLMESVLLATMGGVAGVLVAIAGVAMLKATAPASMPLLDAVHIDGMVLLFTAVLSLCTGIAFGLAPAVRAMRMSLRTGLSEGSGASGTVRSERLRRALVTVQAALALALLSGAGLFLRSLVRLQHVDLGFSEQGVLTARVALPNARYQSDAQVTTFYDQLRNSVATLPGVRAVGFASDIPLGGGYSYLTFDVVGRAPPGPNDHPSDLIPSVADSAYFGAMGIVLERGRMFASSDNAGAPKVALVNEELVRRYFPGANPIGAQINMSGPGSDGVITIVGVLKTTRLDGVGRDSYPQMFTPIAQAIDRVVYLTVRTNGSDPALLIPAIRRAVTAIDPLQPISDVHTMSDRVAESLGQSRLDSVLLTGLSVLALVIAGLGVYGVVSYGVARRTREIGVRLALGASRGNVLSLITRQGMRPVLVGVVLGLIGSVALGRVTRTLLFGSDGVDLVTFGAAAALFAAIAVLACLVPAARAARVAPSIALRSE